MLALLSNVVHLKLVTGFEADEYRRLENADDAEWLHLLRQVKTLHVSQEFAGSVALALEDITEDIAAEMLPALDSVFLVGQPVSSVDEFVAVRQLSGLPVTVVDTETEFDERLRSHVDE